MSQLKKDVRTRFRHIVFERDKGHCVVPSCNRVAVDAHHIIERVLWIDPGEFGGYIEDNGVCLCEEHHRHAEKDWIPPQALRNWAGIVRRLLPRQFDPVDVYTKWGKVLRSPTRNMWENVKYPHTPYLPFSPSVDERDIDDAGYSDVECLVGKPLIVTTKMDGSNALLTRQCVASRNASVATHKSFDMLKSVHSKISYCIPDYIQIFGEWLYAKHSIHYLALDNLFQVFAVYHRGQKLWLGWDEVEKWAMVLGFPTVPVVRMVQETNVGKLSSVVSYLGEVAVKSGHEGIVVRSIYPFYYGQFSGNVAKYVRANHVTTDVHWSEQPIIRNRVGGVPLC